MDNLNLNKHISGQFNAELESIRTQVMTMGGMVEQQLSDAITAMHNQDSELAKRVIEGDHNVNMMEVAIDEACVRIIAKRQPTASDLRLVMAIIKTIAELERIGDVADKICRTALEKFSQQHQPLLVSLESLGRHTVQMLHDVLDAFARMDLDEAVRIYREDKKVDQEYEGIVRQLMTYMMEDSRTIPSVLTALFCARSIERIGDRCQNICEYIFYFVKGQDFRHVGGDELDKLLAGKKPQKGERGGEGDTDRVICVAGGANASPPYVNSTRNIPPARLPQRWQLRQIGKGCHFWMVDRLVVRIGAEVKHLHPRINP